MTPNEPKLSDRRSGRGTCMVGGKAVVEAGAVTAEPVRCSAWLGDVGRLGIKLVDVFGACGADRRATVAPSVGEEMRGNGNSG